MATPSPSNPDRPEEVKKLNEALRNELAERKSAEQQLRESESRLQAFCENSPNLIFIKDREGRYLYVNREFGRALRVDRESIRGKRDEDVFDPDQAAAFQANDSKVFESGLPMEFEERAREEDGVHTSIVHKFPLFDADGNIYAVGGIVTDITDRRRSREALDQSEERHRNVIETATDAVISVDARSEIRFVNPAATRIFGYEASEMVGQSLTMLMPEYLRQLHKEGFERYLNTGKRHMAWQGVQLVGLRRNGEQFPVEVSFGEVVNNGQHIFTGFIRDATDRKLAEEIRTSHARQAGLRGEVSALFASGESVSSVLRRITETVAHHLNASIVQIWLLSPGSADLELEATAVTPAHSGEVRVWTPPREAILRSIAFEKKPHLANELGNDPALPGDAWKRSEGFEEFAAFAGYPLLVEGRAVGVMAIFAREPLTAAVFEMMVPITDRIAEGIERRRKEEELQTAHAELARAARAMVIGELTASIAHEINQPLATIVTNASACLHFLASVPPDMNEVSAAIADISEAATRASAVITRIRALLKKGSLEQTEVDVNEIIRDVLVFVRNEIARNRVSLEIDLLPWLPVVVGNRVELQQVMLNLIMNGIEAMTSITESARRLIIRSRVFPPRSVLVLVKDFGAGIDERALPKIFEPFFTSKSNGMGMGLSIARSIIEAHGGHMSVESTLEAGASFQFTLPMAIGASR